MLMMRKTIKWLIFPSRSNDGGQALVEYVLMLAVSLSIVAAIGYGFKKGLVKLWSIFHKEISSPCPACQPNNPSYRFR
jgi:uncharacterized membrane protein